MNINPLKTQIINSTWTSPKKRKAPIENGVHTDKSGTVRHYKDSKLHNTKGPAIEGPRGFKQYMIEDELHRDDGPAMIYADGTKRYFLYNEEIDESEYLRVLNCPLKELPLHFKTKLEPIARRRLKNNTHTSE